MEWKWQLVVVYLAQGLPDTVTIVIWGYLERPCSRNYVSLKSQNTSKNWHFTPSSSSSTSISFLQLPNFMLIKETPNPDQIPSHHGFKCFFLHIHVPYSLHSVSSMSSYFSFPFPSHSCNQERHMTFLWNYSDPVLIAFPLTSDLLRKVLLQPSFPLNWWFCVMLGAYQNHLRWVVGTGEWWWWW